LLRAVSSSLLSLLLLTTFLWGGCVACEQYFMFGQQHGCCRPDGHCKTKTPQQNGAERGCQQIAFEHQQSIHLQIDLPIVAVAMIAVPAANTTASVSRRDALPVDPSPPDRQALHSTFLI
jgi:hypothetical protein